MNSNNSIIFDNCYNSLLKDESFFLFLKKNIKGFFINNYVCFCKHSSPSPLSLPSPLPSPLPLPLSLPLPPNNYCFCCMKKIIQCPRFKNYYINLYNWYSQTNTNSNNNSNDNSNDNDNVGLFHPLDIIKCFESIHDYLTLDEIKYFKSPWLNGIYNGSDTTNLTVFTIFEALCLQGHVETLQWLYECIGKSLKELSGFIQQRIFIKLCKQKPHENPRAPQVLSWLLSLQIFKKLNVNANNDEAFREACWKGCLETVKVLIKNTNKNQIINIHAENDEAFRLACMNGYINIVQFLLDLQDNQAIQAINVCNIEWGFRWACCNGHVNVMKCLLQLKEKQRINVHAEDDAAFQRACNSGQTKIVELLLELSGDREIKVNDYNVLAFQRACEKENIKNIKNIKLLSRLREKEKRKNNACVGSEEAVHVVNQNSHSNMVHLLSSLQRKRKLNTILL